jgi:hypothetical protein
MPDLATEYTIGSRHDRVHSPPRVAEATHDGSDVVTSPGALAPQARALLSFQGPLHARAEGLSGQARSAHRATKQYNARPRLPPLPG